MLHYCILPHKNCLRPWELQMRPSTTLNLYCHLRILRRMLNPRGNHQNSYVSQCYLIASDFCFCIKAFLDVIHFSCNWLLFCMYHLHFSCDFERYSQNESLLLPHNSNICIQNSSTCTLRRCLGELHARDASKLHMSFLKKKVPIFLIYMLVGYYISQFTVEADCFADSRLFKQPRSVIYHWNQYGEEIKKKCRSVRLSVCLSVRF